MNRRTFLRTVGIALVGTMVPKIPFKESIVIDNSYLFDELNITTFKMIKPLLDSYFKPSPLFAHVREYQSKDFVFPLKGK